MIFPTEPGYILGYVYNMKALHSTSIGKPGVIAILHAGREGGGGGGGGGGGDYLYHLLLYLVLDVYLRG